MSNSEHERRLREAVKNQDSAADLSGCDLSGIRFSSIRIAGANLRGADLRKAELSGGYFRGCNLQETNFSKSKMVGSDVREANLVKADLTAADWTEAVLAGASLAGANLSNAKLVKSRLEGTDLTDALLKGTDLRGVRGLTAEQLESARDSSKAILDERMLAALGRTASQSVARHGKSGRQPIAPLHVDLFFPEAKPCFGDVFLLCGSAHPHFPLSGSFGFEELSHLGIEQVDDYFAICIDGDPAIWIYPLVAGKVVEHHPGPFDGLRFEPAEAKHNRRLHQCVEKIERGLRVPFNRS